jgi:hypothetical protein
MPPRPLPAAWRLLHLGLVATFVAQCAYIGWQVFVVLRPPGVLGPLWGHALDIDHDLLVARRLYSQEGWQALVGLALYLAVTEILPRRWPAPTPTDR